MDRYLSEQEAQHPGFSADLDMIVQERKRIRVAPKTGCVPATEGQGSNSEDVRRRQ